MEFDVILSAITTVGFPIVCTVACGWFVVKTNKEAREDNKAQIKEMREESTGREERLYQQIDKFSDTIDKFGDTLIKIDSRLEKIEKDTQNWDKIR